jgi:lysophospholipase L1-like esterase
VSAEQIIDGMKQLIARAHAKGVKIYGATLTPFGGAGWPYHSSRNEKKREAVNAWIRNGGAFDGVADFDKAIRDPARPDRMLQAYDSGDHLHPNGAGYEAMANAVDLAWFRQ